MSKQEIYGRMDAPIANGASSSSAISTHPYGPHGFAVEFDGGWTAANLGFSVSMDASTWLPVHLATGDRAVIENAAASSVRIAPEAAWVIGQYRYFRLDSIDASEVAVPQGAARALKVVFLNN